MTDLDLLKAFRAAFPGQHRYGPKANLAQLRRVMRRTHYTPKQMMARVERWRGRRDDCSPWDLLQDPAPRAILAEE